jgi:cell division protein FtsB
MKTHRPQPVLNARMKWLVLGLALGSFAAAIGFGREVLRSRQIDREIAELKSESERLRARNFEIASLHASLSSGEYVEREARTKLNLQKEGERVVVVRKEAESPPGSSEAPAPEWTNVKKWWTYFTNRQALEDYARARQPNS